MSLNILFLHDSRHEATPWRDGSTRYRCYHLAEALRGMGHLADVASLPEIRIAHLSRYHVVCVQRPHPGKILDQILKRCRRLGIPTVADVDDLIFVPRFCSLSPSVINQQASEFSVRARFRKNLEAMLCFDEVTVATEPLAQHWREQTAQRRVTVIPNGLSRSWLATPTSPAPGRDSAMKTITYLPGSSSHDRDFAEIVDILADTVQRRDNVQLLIVGSLHIDERRFPASRLHRAAWVDYHDLPQIIAGSTVTLAPLVASPFTHAKSHIKFIESAAFATPVICSPNQDICRHQLEGLHVADNAQAWRTALDRVLDEPHDHAALENMRAYVHRTATAERSAEALLEHWQFEHHGPRKQAMAQFTS